MSSWARDPEALRAWYREHLGVAIEEWGGVGFTAERGDVTVWSIFSGDTEYWPREQQVMVNYRVRDLDAFLSRLAPEDPSRYRHNDEGPDDMPAHLKAALTQVQLTIPVVDGGLRLGTWQGVFVLEHRSQPHRRELILTLFGE